MMQLGVVLTFLGTGNAFSDQGRYNSSVYVEWILNHSILIDCSPPAVCHIKKMGISLNELKYVFISHLHGDHCLGLPLLFLEYRFRNRKDDNPLIIIGPTETQETVETIFNLVFPNIELPNLDYIIAKDQKEASCGKISFKAFAMSHIGVKEAYGYRIIVGDKIIGFSGDTGSCENLFNVAEGTDVFVLECENFETQEPYHMDYKTIEKDLPRFSSKKIILTHLGIESLAAQTAGTLQQSEKLLIAKDMWQLKL
ncbi:MAG: MBL fold metallo-hydrolase [Candidatus Hodarchaeota archaeon]